MINISGNKPWMTVFARFPRCLAVNSRDREGRKHQPLLKKKKKKKKIIIIKSPQAQHAELTVEQEFCHTSVLKTGLCSDYPETFLA